METLKSIKSLVLAIVLTLSLVFVLSACKKAEYVPTPVVPMSPATEIPTATAPVE